MASGGYERQNTRLVYTNIKEQLNREEELESEFVDVPIDFKGKVIGKGGCVIKEIRQTSGARVSSQCMEEKGFTVTGNKEQRALAKTLILEKVQEEQVIRSLSGELVEIPNDYKGIVIGRMGDNLIRISNQTGAKVIRKNKEVYIVSGNEEQRKQAKMHMKIKIIGARLRGLENKFNKACCYIDGCNLPEDCELKLEEMVQGDRTVLPESHAYYRLKPAEDYEPRETCSLSDDPIYLSKLVNDTLESLYKVKQEMKTKEYLKVDMWCHFGTAIIRGPDEEEVNEGKWSIDEATEKFRPSDGVYWKIAFKEGVNLDEKILEANVCEKTPEEYKDYAARYDLTFLTPSGHQMRAKVWITKKNVGKRLEDIPIPLSDVKNILDEIHFEDEATRSRCRGWMVLPSRKYLQADILFPGCEFDCRLTIRGQFDCGLDTDYVPNEEARQALSSYLSELKLTDEDDIGICLPDKIIPDGFHLIHKRCSKRSLYEISRGFTIIRSKESSWRSDAITEESRESTDFHLHCKEWDELLNSGEWEPEKIADKLPEFFRFVKKVQSFVSARAVPPEILARGFVAVEAYNKALSDGITFVKRVPIMLIGQDRAGKTSLKKSLKGICFDPKEDSTFGIDVDPSHFEVSTESWKTGEMDQNQDSDTAITADYQTARFIVDSLKEKGKSTKSETDTGESAGSFDPELTKMLEDSRPVNSPKDPELSQTPRDLALSLSRHVPHVPPDPIERNQEGVNYSYPDVPDEVASKTETLLQGNWEDNGEEIYSTLWDFAGQSVYYVTHPLFLTARAIYCLVYDLSLNPHDNAKPVVKQGVYEGIQESFNLKTNMDYLDFWMMSVASQASSLEDGLRSDVLPEKIPPVFLVCTHADTPYGGRDPKDLARKIFGCLKNKPYGAQLSGVFFVDNTCLRVNKTECPEVQRLRKEVLAVAKELPHINEAVPIKWLQFEKKLQAVKEKGDKYISLETANDIATKECNIDEGKETLMNFLHDLRSLIHFDDTAKLNNTVVLDPQWLVDVFKMVITVKPHDPQDKQDMKFLDLWDKLEKEGILDEKLLAHVWAPLFENEETSESLIGIMERFSLLCPWPSDAASGNKNYLVPSMLKSHPTNDILELVASAKIPSLFLKFENGQVPPGLFPRLILQLFQWGNKNIWRSEKPQLFHDFARFFTAEFIGYSVILMCHASSVEVVVHGGNLGVNSEDDLYSKMTSSANIHHDTTGETCARLMKRQLGSMLERMRNEFPWLRNMTYEMSVICPVCCTRKAVDYCQTHDVKGCRKEQCLHFLNVSELCNARGSFICTKSASAKNVGVQVMQFSPWFATPEQQLPVGEHGESTSFSGEENEKNALALPGEVLESLLSTPCDSKQVVVRYMESLQLDQTSLEKSELDPETKKAIRCLARKAKCSDRLDVVEHLREITPAGTTGPLLPESLDVRKIPYSQARQLTIALTVVGAGGDKWKFVAEKLGLNSDEIRFLDERHTNPAANLISFIADHRCLTVGELYKVLCDCGIPVIADKL